MTDHESYSSPLAERYASRTMLKLWSPATRYGHWRRLWRRRCRANTHGCAGRRYGGCGSTSGQPAAPAAGVTRAVSIGRGFCGGNGSTRRRSWSSFGWPSGGGSFFGASSARLCCAGG